MNVAAKLQLRPQQSVAILGEPQDVNLDLSGYPTVVDPGSADAVLVFCTNSQELERRRGSVVEAARRDALAWLAYPKAGQRATDLDRDRVRDLMAAHGVRPVRQIAVNDVWSALRFRAA